MNVMNLNNSIPGWKYYNHAAVPTTAPHEIPDLTPIKDGSIWHLNGKNPLLARYTTEWDCGYDTGWWYIIKDAPFNIESLSKNSRKHIKEAFRKVRVEKIDPAEHITELYECYKQAFSKYKLADNEISFECFQNGCINATADGIAYWAGFDLQDNRLIGYLTSKQNSDWTEIYTAKFDPRFLNLRVSDALYASVLEYYLNMQGCKYVSSGSRSINHVTNTQEYKESHFNYRKCFCKLNIVYSPKIQTVIRILYPIRSIVNLLGRVNEQFHQVSAILKMEEIARKSVRK